MVSIILKVLLKKNKSNDVSLPSVKEIYALTSSIMGTIFNIILCVGKLVAGAMSHSIAITVDGFNNLADAGTSLASILGFRIAGLGAGEDHPFGHGRFEWLMGLMADLAIIVMGIEAVKSAIESIKAPQKPQIMYQVVAILLVSIAVKLYMYFYNRKIAKKIDSIAVKAIALDSLTDVASTCIVLLSFVIQSYTKMPVDGWCGLILAIMIISTGYKTLRDTIDKLLGRSPDKKIIDQFLSVILKHDEVLGINNFMIHDYGFGRMVVSLHIEGKYETGSEVYYSIANRIQYELFNQMGCETTIQIDLLITDKETKYQIQKSIEDTIEEYSSEIQMRNLCVIGTQNYINVTFFLIIPYKLKNIGTEVSESIEQRLKLLNENYCTIAKIMLPHYERIKPVFKKKCD